MHATAVSKFGWTNLDLNHGTSLQKLNSTLLKKEFLQILENPELFWQLFCQKCASLELKCRPEIEKWLKESFNPEVDRETLTIYGKSVNNLSEWIETVRQFCFASISKQRDTCDLIFCHFGKDVQLLAQDLNGFSLEENLYTFYAHPALQEVFQSLGYSIEQKKGSYFYQLGQGYRIDPTPQKPMKRDTPHSNSCSYLHICWGAPSEEGEEKKGV